MSEDPAARARARMVERQLGRRGIRDPRVLQAMRTVPRERFVPDWLAVEAYEDRPLPIGEDQTISQPYIVALMIEGLRLAPGDRVLEVGLGSGYAAAVLGLLAREVFALDRHEALAQAAAGRLTEQGYDNVHVEVRDGTLGWPEEAPFDAILVSAGGPAVPPPLLDQLAPGGRMVIPVGEGQEQELLRLTRRADGTIEREELGQVRFVPLVGEEGWADRDHAP